ncbi:MAG TPA: cell division protein FtsH [Lachnospiraceae bacterium]|jgi:cell division protein DivIC|nr:cell division protein FtsH [Lachnospiraceae bacterium]
MGKLRRSHKKGTGIGIIAFVVLILFGIVAFRKIDLEKRSVQAKQKIEELDAQIAEEKERTEEIKNLEAYVHTKRYIEDVAREKLGLVYKDEIILKQEEE